MSGIRILAIGDVVGRPGRRAIREKLPELREQYAPCIVIVNGENAAGGSGITPDTAKALFDAGADVVTTGDHFYDNSAISDLIENEPRVLRPANWSKHAPGRGWGVFESAECGTKFGVANLMGRTYMGVPAGNFFDEADAALEELAREAKIVVVDFHAEATSEKIAFGRYLDGRASLVFGTHTHVATADAKVLPGGTAYISDLGMTGPHDSVLGRDYEAVLKRLKTGVPSRFEVAKGDVRICGAVATVDRENGKAASIERVELALQ